MSYVRCSNHRLRIRAGTNFRSISIGAQSTHNWFMNWRVKNPSRPSSSDI